MRKLLIVPIFFFFLNAFGQNLTMSQILEIKKKDLGNAEEYLTAHGWEFLEAEEPTFESLGHAQFTYNRDRSSRRAESFFTFLYSQFSAKTRILIQVNKREKYNEYLSAIKGYGAALIKSEIKDGSIVKVYKGATTAFQLTTTTTTNYFDEEVASWSIFIVSNDDYEENWAND